MFNFKYSDHLVKNLINSELERQSILKISDDNEVLSELKRSAEFENVMYFANILNLEVDLSHARSIVLGRRINQDSKDVGLNKMLINLRKSDEYVNSVIGLQSIKLDINLISHLNKIILDGIEEEWEIEMRGSEYMDTYPQMFTVEKDNLPEWFQKVNMLSDWVVENEEDRHPLIIIAGIMFTLFYLQPLKYANTPTILLVYSYFFKKYGLDSNGLISSYQFFVESRTALERSFSFVSNNLDNYQKWLELFIDTYSKHLINVKLNLTEKIADIQKAGKDDDVLDLNQRQLRILKYLQSAPYLKRDDYVHLMEVSTMTAYRDLRHLLDKKMLRTDGFGRGTKYMLITR